MAVMLALGAALALTGAWLGHRLHLPGGPLVGALLAVMPVSALTGASLQTPRVVSFLAFAVVGWGLGAGLTTAALERIRSAPKPVACILGTLTATAATLAVIGRRWWDLDLPTALLAAAPGGLSQMAALTIDFEADVPLLIAVHVLRVTSIVILVPLITRVILRRAGR